MSVMNNKFIQRFTEFLTQIVLKLFVSKKSRESFSMSFSHNLEFLPLDNAYSEILAKSHGQNLDRLDLPNLDPYNIGLGQGTRSDFLT